MIIRLEEDAIKIEGKIIKKELYDFELNIT